MPKDYAQKNAGPTSKGILQSIIKLCLLSLIVAVVSFGVRYLYLNVDFARLEKKAIATLPQNNKRQSQVQSTKPQFEFYTMLPNGGTAKLPPVKKIITEKPRLIQQTETQATPVRISTPMTAPLTQKSTVAASPIKKTPRIIKAREKIKAKLIPKHRTRNQAQNSFLLQVGSFRNFSDAHKLKAKLLLEGFKVSISTFTNEATTWHRVEVGPYHSLNQAQKAQDTLEDADLNCLLKRIA
jgi:cell division protein FtsN